MGSCPIPWSGSRGGLRFVSLCVNLKQFGYHGSCVATGGVEERAVEALEGDAGWRRRGTGDTVRRFYQAVQGYSR